jgi:hypothetical protein
MIIRDRKYLYICETCAHAPPKLLRPSLIHDYFSSFLVALDLYFRIYTNTSIAV